MYIPVEDFINFCWRDLVSHEFGLKGWSPSINKLCKHPWIYLLLHFPFSLPGLRSKGMSTLELLTTLKRIGVGDVVITFTHPVSPRSKETQSC
jgi:hypothetical protein